MNQKLLTGAVAAMAFLLPSTAMGQTADFNIIPQPQQVVADASAPFTLNSNTFIYVQTNSQDMKRNATMLASYIQEATGIRPTIGKLVKGNPAIILSIDKTISNAEGYRLNSDAKQIRIAGASAAGGCLISRWITSPTWKRRSRMRTALPSRLCASRCHSATAKLHK